MGAFEYQALDAKGRKRKGVLEGDTARQARQKLREQGLTPLKIEAVMEGEKNSKSGGFSFGGISAVDLALFTRQLATLSQSGLPLEQALNTVSQQSEKAKITRIILAVRSKVMEGHPLVTGMAEFPHVFSDLYRATIAAGEQSGFLGVVLERLADYTEQRQIMRQKVQLALVYPAILTIMAIVVTVGLMIYVVPEVVKVFQDTGQTLPDLTLGLISLSEFLQNYGLFLLLGILVLGIGIKALLRVENIKYQVHKFTLKLPVIGRLARAINTGRFLRTLSILTASGVPILNALQIASQVVGNLPMRSAVETASQKVKEGGSLNGALTQSKLFPPMAIQLIASGETSGNLDEMLDRAAINQEREIESTISTLLGLFEPLLILAMGVMVLIIVLAILIPIFDLNQLVK